MSGIWLDFYVFWATVAIRIKLFVGKFIDHIRGGIFTWLLSLPQSVITANYLPWAALRIIYYAYQLPKQGDNPENRARAVGLAVQASI
jgi:hypothetical protein